MTYHPLEVQLSVSEVPKEGKGNTPYNLLQVHGGGLYIAETQSKYGTHILTIIIASVYTIPYVLFPTDVTWHECGKDPISH